MRAVAVARTNIALVKYWGKRDAALNLPAAGSLSLTLDGLSTRTEVRFDAALGRDRLLLGGLEVDGNPRLRVEQLLDLVRARAGIDLRAHVASANDFPTASGLASSASGFAALALAATRAAGLSLPLPELSVLARRGSGSAARSLFGGFAEMRAGTRADGSDAFAEGLVDRAAADAWGVRMVVAVTSAAAKATGSTDGMRQTALTSPFYPAWVASVDGDLALARAALTKGDLEALGVVAEQSALTMHASALAARPAVVYFAGVTIDGYREIVAMRKAGTPAWFTCDAGPHIKALTHRDHAAAVAARLGKLPGVLETRICAPGAPAEIIE